MNVFPLAPASKNTCIAYRIPRFKIPGIERSRTYRVAREQETVHFHQLKSCLRNNFNEVMVAFCTSKL
jgi:hypothetical protein